MTSPSGSAFLFATVDDVRPLLLKGSKLSPQREAFLAEHLRMLTAKLSAWFVGLRVAWDKAAPGSELRELVRAMVIGAASQIMANPERMSSETMGPYAYSRFGSDDYFKDLFQKEDFEALARLLGNNKKRFGNFVPKQDVRPMVAKYRRYHPSFTRKY